MRPPVAASTAAVAEAATALNRSRSISAKIDNNR